LGKHTHVDTIIVLSEDSKQFLTNVKYKVLKVPLDIFLQTILSGCQAIGNWQWTCNFCYLWLFNFRWSLIHIFQHFASLYLFSFSSVSFLKYFKVFSLSQCTLTKECLVHKFDLYNRSWYAGVCDRLFDLVRYEMTKACLWVKRC
jgi:hypothetical protein